MGFAENSLEGFTAVLSSKAAIPGGGGASALVGAVGVSLSNMVGSLTVGKAGYADVEDDVRELMDRGEALRWELLRLIDADAEVFVPLSKAYGIPKDDPSRAETMEAALKLACSVPLAIMRACKEAIGLLARMGQQGSALALSDVGVGVACAKAALQGASLNIFINTKAMADRSYAKTLEDEADELLDTYCKLADETYDSVVARLRG